MKNLSRRAAIGRRLESISLAHEVDRIARETLREVVDEAARGGLHLNSAQLQAMAGAPISTVN